MMLPNKSLLQPGSPASRSHGRYFAVMGDSTKEPGGGLPAAELFR